MEKEETVQEDKRPIKWNNSEPRDLTALWVGYSLSVRAENQGREWVMRITGPDGYMAQSTHVSVDSAKQAAAKTVRKALKAAQKPQE